MTRKTNQSIPGKISLLTSECNFVSANVVKNILDTMPKYSTIVSLFDSVTATLSTLLKKRVMVVRNNRFYVIGSS